MQCPEQRTDNIFLQLYPTRTQKNGDLAVVSSSLVFFFPEPKLGTKSEILRDVKTGGENWKRMIFAPYPSDLAIIQHPSVTITTSNIWHHHASSTQLVSSIAPWFPCTWRITVPSKWLLTPIYEPWNGHLEAEQPRLEDLLSPWLLTTETNWGDPPGIPFFLFTIITIITRSVYLWQVDNAVEIEVLERDFSIIRSGNGMGFACGFRGFHYWRSLKKSLWVMKNAWLFRVYRGLYYPVCGDCRKKLGSLLHNQDLMESKRFFYDPNPWAFWAGRTKVVFSGWNDYWPAHRSRVRGLQKTRYQPLHGKWLSNPGQTCRHVQLRKVVLPNFFIHGDLLRLGIWTPKTYQKLFRRYSMTGCLRNLVCGNPNMLVRFLEIEPFGVSQKFARTSLFHGRVLLFEITKNPLSKRNWSGIFPTGTLC